MAPADVPGNGLFEYGEDAEKIEPGIEKAPADGIYAFGPFPADTLFFVAGRDSRFSRPAP